MLRQRVRQTRLGCWQKDRRYKPHPDQIHCSRKVSQKQVLRKGVVEDAPPGAQHGFAVASQIPGGADTGRPVVVVGIVKTGVANLNVRAGGGIEI